LLYYWPRAAVLQFYASVADSPSTVSIRRGRLHAPARMRHADWLEIAQMLREAGKQVVLSTPVLVESDSDIAVMRRVCAQDDYLVEANDLGAVRCMGGRPFVGGPHLNVYHADTLAWLASLGAVGCTVPVEMDGRTMAALAAARRRVSIWKRWSGAACRWRSPRAALPRAITVCARTPANSAAWTIRTGWWRTRARGRRSSRSTASRRSRPLASTSAPKCRGWRRPVLV
jgi:collagenase-like PrtC family protease